MNAKDRAIVTRWRARLAIRRELLLRARRRHEWNPTTESRALLEKRKRQVGEAERVIARRVGTIQVRQPFPMRLAGYGVLGFLRDVTVHHDAGEIGPGPSTNEVASKLQGYDSLHTRRWRGGIGYHEAIAPDGTLWKMRSRLSKGAHVGGHNSGNYGVMLLGNFELQHPTPAQVETLQRRLTQPPPPGLPDLRGKRVRGHSDWPPPGGSTFCPGRNLKPAVRRLPNYAKG